MAGSTYHNHSLVTVRVEQNGREREAELFGAFNVFAVQQWSVFHNSLHQTGTSVLAADSKIILSKCKANKTTVNY